MLSYASSTPSSLTSPAGPRNSSTPPAPSPGTTPTPYGTPHPPPRQEAVAPPPTPTALAMVMPVASCCSATPANTTTQKPPGTTTTTATTTPHTTTYTTQDPLGLAPAPNPTRYVTNPTQQIDPLGLALCDPLEEHPLYADRNVDGTFRGENGAASNGGRAHAVYAELELAGRTSDGWLFDTRLPGSKLRPDAYLVTPTEVHIRELKPATPSGMRKGKSQVNGHTQHTRSLFPNHSIRSTVDHYKP